MKWPKKLSWLKKLFNSPIWLILSIVFILFIQVPIFFKDTNHLAYNVEPMPDIMQYMVAADNLAHGWGWGLHYHGSKANIVVPPLYTLYLTIWRLILPSTPIFFVAANIFLQIATIFLLYKIARKIADESKQFWVTPALLVLYLSFASSSWYASLAMIENLGLLLMAAILAVLILMKNAWRQYLLLLGLASVCFLSKFTFIPLAATIFIILLIKLVATKQWRLILGVCATGLVMVAVVWFLFPIIPRMFLGDNQFFSTDFISPNLAALWTLLSGRPELILWRYIPFSTALLWPTTIVLTILNWRHRQVRLLNIFIWLLVLSLLPLPLIFNVFDFRHFLQFIPILSVLTIANVAIFITNLKTKKIRLVCFIFLAVLFFAQIFNQKDLYIDLYRKNILHSEVPWTYKAIQSFDEYFSAQENQGRGNYLLFFISPHAGQYLSELDSYRFLPITDESVTFGAITSSNYGADLDGERLLNDRFNYYDEMLQNGIPIYVTNYGTDKIIAHHLAIDELKEYFHAELVQEACLGSCNLYKLFAHHEELKN